MLSSFIGKTENFDVNKFLGFFKCECLKIGEKKNGDQRGCEGPPPGTGAEMRISSRRVPYGGRMPEGLIGGRSLLCDHREGGQPATAK